jgi:hypothetical protein
LRFLLKTVVARCCFFIGGGYFLFVNALDIAFANDCGRDKFQYGSCEQIPQAIADFFSLVWLVSFFGYVVIAPLLVLIALGFEIHAWLRERTK